MSQVDVTMFSVLTQTITFVGLVIYSFWLVSVFYFFMKNFNAVYRIIDKNIQVIMLVFNKF